MNEWISIKDKLPKENMYVLVCLDTKHVSIDRYVNKHGFKCFGWYENSITHWMPLPKPPK